MKTASYRLSGYYEPPCTGCANYGRCSALRLACVTYARFCGCFFSAIHKYKDEPMIPHRAIYEAVINEEDRDEALGN